MSRIQLSAEHLTVARGSTTIFRSLSFSLSAGDILFVTGANGSGKSTLLQVLAGRLPFSEGRIEVSGSALSRQSPTGLFLQTGRVFPSMSVGEQIHMSAFKRDSGLPGWLLSIMPSLKPIWRTTGRHLSGGERHIAALALVISRSPEILLLDEPLAGLDSVRVEEVADLVQACADERQMIVVLAEHATGTISVPCTQRLDLEHHRTQTGDGGGNDVQTIHS